MEEAGAGHGDGVGDLLKVARVREACNHVDGRDLCKAVVGDVCHLIRDLVDVLPNNLVDRKLWAMLWPRRSRQKSHCASSLILCSQQHI